MFKIQANKTATRFIDVTEQNLQTLKKYELLNNLVDSNNIVTEDVVEKLKYNTRALLEANTQKDNNLLDIAIDVIYHNNMKAFALEKLIELYNEWNKNNVE